MNNTYPIFSIWVKQTEVGYGKKICCDRVNVTIQNLQVFDLTKYPETLDPQIDYDKDFALTQNEILGLNEEQDNQKMMLQLEVTLFAYPGEDCGCEKSIGPDYNVALSMKLQKIKFNFMLENSLRIVFYAVNDIGKLFLTKATADTGLESGEEEEVIEEEEIIDDFESQDYGTEAEKAVDDDFWRTFDLNQEKFVPGLDI